jgi:hypothetical protein
VEAFPFNSGNFRSGRKANGNAPGTVFYEIRSLKVFYFARSKAYCRTEVNRPVSSIGVHPVCIRCANYPRASHFSPEISDFASPETVCEPLQRQPILPDTLCTKYPRHKAEYPGSIPAGLQVLDFKVQQFKVRGGLKVTPYCIE